MVVRIVVPWLMKSSEGKDSFICTFLKSVLFLTDKAAEKQKILPVPFTGRSVERNRKQMSWLPVSGPIRSGRRNMVVFGPLLQGSPAFSVPLFSFLISLTSFSPVLPDTVKCTAVFPYKFQKHG